MAHAVKDDLRDGPLADGVIASLIPYSGGKAVHGAAEIEARNF